MVNVTKIEMLIKEKGWSKSYFCSLFSKNRGWIRDWKQGVGLPDENTLQAIADKLDTTVDYLTDKTEQKNKPTTKSDELSEENRKRLELIKALSPEDQKRIDDILISFSKNHQ